MYGSIYIMYFIQVRYIIYIYILLSKLLQMSLIFTLFASRHPALTLPFTTLLSVHICSLANLFQAPRPLPSEICHSVPGIHAYGSKCIFKIALTRFLIDWIWSVKRGISNIPSTGQVMVLLRRQETLVEEQVLGLE